MVRNGIPKMETTFYEEHSFHRRTPGDVARLKRNMTLDLNERGVCVKKPRTTAVTAAPVLSSPDLTMLKLGSPELEKLIIDQQNGLVTTTPTPTTQILFPRNVTEEQEIYARGFVDALNELHHSDSSQGGATAPELTYLDSRSRYPPPSQGFGFLVSHPSDVIVKDEPQTVPNVNASPPVSPIDMECQERIKLERKRQRNRVAASKCRRRKLERIARLEEKVKLLKGENVELTGVVNKLKEHVCLLKEQVMDHVNSGCQITLQEFQ